MTAFPSDDDRRTDTNAPAARMPLITILEGPGHLPIHMQIKRALLYAIGSGQLPPGAQLPSVRELAHELHLAPNTVARAYQELQEEGLLTSHPGRGTFVSRLLASAPLPNKSQALRSILEPAIASARAIGFADAQIRAAVAELLTAPSLCVGLIALNDYVLSRWDAILKEEFSDLGIQIVPFTIEQLRMQLPEALARLAGVKHVLSLITTYAEAKSLLHPHGKHVSTLITEMAMQSHHALRDLPDTHLIGLVCHDLYASSMLGLISPYVDLMRVRRVASTDDPGIAAVLAEAEIVLCTTSMVERIRQQAPATTLIVHIEFVPNRLCFSQLRDLFIRDVVDAS